ncbi:MAG: FAD-dependent oxidoreductase [Spirochaetes bacterium]|nr:FAD-dependent oxidoreductase [Spirochaetota bacterium]
MNAVMESARATPVVFECDLCVVGGSCTGVFAAVAAARRGLTVALVESSNQFGGNTTAGFVALWHSFRDTRDEDTIIGGLSAEFVSRLRPRGAVVEATEHNPHAHFMLSPGESAIELDALVEEHGIHPFLHARVVGAQVEAGRARAVILEDKSGRRAIRAAHFIDASGDADLVRLCGGETYAHPAVQPPTMACLVSGLDELKRAVPGFQLQKAVFDAANPRALPPGFLWHYRLPGAGRLDFLFGTRVHGVDCGEAADLTRAEMEGRKQVRRLLDLVREAQPSHPVTLAALPARIGIRETRHAKCLHRLTEGEVLTGKRFPDAIANGTYRVDIHRQGGAGLTFRYLDGKQVEVHGDGSQTEGRWRPVQERDPAFYQIPYRSLVAAGLSNVLAVGRALDADPGAFGAVRVQVNCNQTGEAAGAAAALAKKTGKPFPELDPAALRADLEAGGAVLR